MKINVRYHADIFIMCAWDNLPGVLTKVIDKFLLHCALDISVNMKMYSIAVDVNLYHPKSGFSLEYICCFLREFMQRELLAQFSRTGIELQYNVWDTVEVAFFKDKS